MAEDKMVVFRREMAKLRSKYARELPGRLEDIRTAWRDFEVSRDGEDFARLHRLVHTMAGSAGTFGHPEVGEAARALERKLKAHLTAGNIPGPDELGGYAGLLEELLRLEGAPATSQSPEAAARQDEKGERAPACPIGLRQVYWFQGGNGEGVVERLAQYGFAVEVFSDISALREQAETRPPGAVVVASDDGSGFAAMADWARQDPVRCDSWLAVAIGPDDFAARLQAVRSGFQEYYSRPVAVSSLADVLDSAVRRHEADPYRVLVVDDDEDFARRNKMVLEEQGWLVRVLHETSRVLAVLGEFRPDLVLMDLHMPDVNGMELAAVIRQLDEFVSVPIVFFSVERDPDEQLKAVSPGADDFLTKNISAEHLVRSLTVRIRRYRVLRSMMIRDSLTGLLNHTNLKLRLEAELERAVRRQGVMALAMLDLDHFKTVNDNYGHPVGDMVLKSLANLLRQRLRRTDVIGRWGGEEFAVVLPDLDGPEDAFRIMDTVREHFKALRHKAGEKEFTVTLSCGVAVHPDYDDPSAMSDAADKALYRAKREGRDRVELAGPGEPG